MIFCLRFTAHRCFTEAYPALTYSLTGHGILDDMDAEIVQLMDPNNMSNKLTPLQSTTKAWHARLYLSAEIEFCRVLQRA